MMAFSKIKGTTTTLPINSHLRYQKASLSIIKPVVPLEMRTVHHYSDITQKPKHQDRHEQDPLVDLLISERDTAHKTLKKNVTDLSQHIQVLVKEYNSIVETLVKIETLHGCQVDQVLQHFLVFHRSNFKSFGIVLRQYLYLEYDPILLKQKIEQEGLIRATQVLIGPKGLFMELFYLLDGIVNSLITEDIADAYGSHIDLKA